MANFLCPQRRGPFRNRKSTTLTIVCKRKRTLADQSPQTTPVLFAPNSLLSGNSKRNAFHLLRHTDERAKSSSLFYQILFKFQELRRYFSSFFPKNIPPIRKTVSLFPASSLSFFSFGDEISCESPSIVGYPGACRSASS